MEIWKQLQEGAICLGIDARDKRGIYEELVKALVEIGLVDSELPLLDEVLRRESVLSTGVGNGVALPHARLKDFEGFVIAFGRPLEPVDVGAVDDQPADLFFLLLADRRDYGTIVRILGRLARICDDEKAREDLRKVKTPAKVIELLKSIETSQQTGGKSS